MKKLNKWFTSILVAAMALMMFGGTAFAVDGETSAVEPAANSPLIGIEQSSSQMDPSYGSSDDTMVFALNQGSISGAPAGTDWSSVQGFTNGMETTITGNPFTSMHYTRDAFPGITFTRTGVYTFTVSEVSISNPYLNKDNRSTTVTITVVADEGTEAGVKVEKTEYMWDGAELESAYFYHTFKTEPAYLGIQKVDQDGNPLAGAVFTLTEIGGWGEGTTAVSDENGDAVLYAADGHYYLTETPPDNYTSDLPEEGIGVKATINEDRSITLTFHKIINGGGLGDELTAGELASYGITINDDQILIVTNTQQEVPVEPEPDTPADSGTTDTTDTAAVTTTASTNVNTGVSDSSEMLTLIVTVLAAASVTAVVFYRKRNEA